MARHQRPGFTMVELLIVIAIILMVSAITIPTIVWTFSDYQLSSSTAHLKAALVAARDGAAADQAPRGIRLVSSLRDPTRLDQVVPLVIPARYSEGLVTTISPPYPGGFTTPYPCLVLCQSIRDSNGLLASPTGWAWNMHLGDLVQIGAHAYTVCGPVITANGEGAINYGTNSTLDIGQGPCEYLYLTNCHDDNTNGWIDEGFDGVDNDGNGVIDDVAEWEPETWTAPLVTASSYTVIRRPIPDNKAGVNLSVPVDLTQSKLLVNPLTKAIDVMVWPNGSVDLSSIYGIPTSVGLPQAKSLFVLTTPKGETSTVSLWTSTGRIE